MPRGINFKSVVYTFNVERQNADVSWIATEDCFLIGNIAHFSQGKLYVDGVVLIGGAPSSTGWWWTSNFSLPIKQGQTIRVINGRDNGNNHYVKVKCYRYYY